MKNLTDYKDYELTRELEKGGFCLYSLFSVDTVNEIISDLNEDKEGEAIPELSIKDGLELLNDVFYDTSDLHDSIKEKIVETYCPDYYN